MIAELERAAREADNDNIGNIIEEGMQGSEAEGKLITKKDLNKALILTV
jgi:hypothetical protein